MWVTRWGKRTRRKDFSTPFLDHGSRTAQHWFGEPINGWRAADADAGLSLIGPGPAGGSEAPVNLEASGDALRRTA